MSTRSMIAAFLLTLLVACSGDDPARPGGAGVATDPSMDPPSATPTTTGGTAPCHGADTGLGDARRDEYLALVSGALEGVESSSVGIVRFMAIGAWSVVLATTPVADPGWFVFESTDGRNQFKDVWAGMAVEDDRPGLVQWATALGAPEDFSTCFAETILK